MLALKPVKSLLMITLTTPETASEPQDAEAPPVTTSTRWIRLTGMTERSWPPLTMGDTARWPLNRTRVLFDPILRRLTLEMPSAPEFEAAALLPCSGVSTSPIEGNSRKDAPRLRLACDVRLEALTVVTGVGAV